MACYAAQAGCVGYGQFYGLVAGGGFEVGIAQFDAYGFARVAFALQVGSYALAELGEDVPEFGAVVRGVQVAGEGGFAADAHGLAVGDNGAVVAPPRGLVQPCAVAFAEGLHEPKGVARGKLAQGVYAAGCKLGIGFWAYAVEFAAGQWPDQCLHIFGLHNADAVGLVKFAGELGQQLIGRYANGASQPRGAKNGLLQQARQRFAVLPLPAWDVGKVDIHLVNATVFHNRRDFGDDGFEAARVLAVALHIYG